MQYVVSDATGSSNIATSASVNNDNTIEFGYTGGKNENGSNANGSSSYESYS